MYLEIPVEEVKKAGEESNRDKAEESRLRGIWMGAGVENRL